MTIREETYLPEGALLNTFFSTTGRFDDDDQTAKKPDPSSPFVPAPSVNEYADDPAKKNKKFFGLF